MRDVDHHVRVLPVVRGGDRYRPCGRSGECQTRLQNHSDRGYQLSDWYELVGQTPVQIEGDILECARRWEALDRRVARTTLFDTCIVSTIFLGFDHAFFGGPPILFETLVSWMGEGGYEQERCSTWPEAEEQHARMCAEASRPSAVFAYIRRHCYRYWQEAKLDLGRRWRELKGIEPTEDEKWLDHIRNRWEEQ
jgi:hypothetical protein